MLEPGRYYGLCMDEYLDMPAVSQGTLALALDECPRAAWHQSHLNPKRVREVSEKSQDIGSVAHSVLLEGHADNVVVIDPAEHRSKPTKGNPFGNVPKGWTNDAIRTARDYVIADGKIPMLPADRDCVAAMVAEALEFIDSLKDTEPAIWAMFQKDCGESEVTFVADLDGVLCRCRADRVSNGLAIVADYKTSAMSVHPDRWGRKQMPDYNFGAALYRRIIAQFVVDKAPPTYVWLAQMQDPPYLCSLVGSDPAWIAIGDARVEAALKLWRECASTGKWHGYPNRVCYPEAPGYLVAQVEAMEIEGAWR